MNNKRMIQILELTASLAKKSVSLLFRHAALGSLCLGLLSLPAAHGSIIGDWRFENGNVAGDSGPNGLSLSLRGTGGVPISYQLPASGAGSAFSNPIPQTGQSNLSAIEGSGTNKLFEQSYYHADDPAFTITSGITIEAYVNLAASGAARVIASQGGSLANSSWALVVGSTGNLIFQSMSTAAGWGSTGFESLNSGFTLTTGHDYYVAYSSTLSDTSSAGAVFYFQDLTAGTALRVMDIAHTNTTINDGTVNFAIGSSSVPGGGALWAGVIDEVRLSNTQLNQDQLQISVPEPSTYLLLTMGAVGLFFLRKRNRPDLTGFLRD